MSQRQIRKARKNLEKLGFDKDYLLSIENEMKTGHQQILNAYKDEKSHEANLQQSTSIENNSTPRLQIRSNVKLTKKQQKYLLSKSDEWFYFNLIYWSLMIFMSVISIIIFLVNDSDNEGFIAKLLISLIIFLIFLIIFYAMYYFVRYNRIRRLTIEFIKSKNGVAETQYKIASWEKYYWLASFTFAGYVAIVTWNEFDPNYPAISKLTELILVPGFWLLLASLPYFIIRKILTKRKSKLSGSAQIASNGHAQNDKHGSNYVTKSKNKLSSLIKTSVVILIVLFTFSSIPPVSDAISLSAGELTSSENIKDVANNSGFSNKGKVYFYKSNPELVNADKLHTVCPTAEEDSIEYGCYIPQDNKLYILDIPDEAYKSIIYVSAAHETLHAVWSNTESAERDKISSKIKEFYNASDNIESNKLRETIKLYGSLDNDSLIDELHSFVGSTVPSPSINTDLEFYYSTYFDNRNTAVQANVTFNSNLDKKIAELKESKNRLETEYSQLGAFKIKYLDGLETAINRSAYYGDTYSYNRNVDAYNNNRNNYNNRVDLYNRQRDEHNAKINAFNEIIKIFYPSKTLDTLTN